MEYILGILLISLMLLLAQRCSPKRWQKYVEWLGVSVLINMAYQLCAVPYRLARVLHDFAQLF